MSYTRLKNASDTRPMSFWAASGNLGSIRCLRRNQ
jgi:hypothetical protein